MFDLKAYLKARRQKLIDSGLCSRCGKKPPKPNRKRCYECCRIEAENTEARRANKPPGTCIEACCNQPAMPDNSRCEHHRDRNREYSRNHKQRIRQKRREEIRISDVF